MIDKKFFKKWFGKYFLIGGFIFFLVKGLIWLGIFLFVGFNLININ